MTSVMADMHKSACEKGMAVKVCPPSKAWVPERDCPKTDFKISPSADCLELYRRLRRSLAFHSVDSIPAQDLYPTQEIRNPSYDGPQEEPRRNAAVAAMRRALERVANFKIVPGST